MFEQAFLSYSTNGLDLAVYDPAPSVQPQKVRPELRHSVPHSRSKQVHRNQENIPQKRRRQIGSEKKQWQSGRRRGREVNAGKMWW